MDPQVVEAPDGHSLNDIQSYLVNFNKEISAGGQTYILASSDAVAHAGQNNIVVSHAGNQLYEGGDILQTVGDDGLSIPKSEGSDTKLKIEGVSSEQLEQPILSHDEGVFSPINIAPMQQQVTTEPLFTVQTGSTAIGAGDSIVAQQNGTQLITVQPNQTGAVVQPQLVAIQGQPQMMAMAAGQPLAAAGQQLVASGQHLVASGTQLVAVQQSQQVVEEEGELEEEEEDGQEQSEGGNYQTVTIVPSEVNQGGEVSYVLIVSQNDQDQKANEDGNIDMSVYDFKEEHRIGGESQDDDSSKKGIKGTPKKPAVVLASQLMCNYCNYTSPKRYLLTRHMKTHSEERPHKCHICDRGFKTVASLQNHINTHTGVRPHKCKECDAAFTTSGELVRHVRYRHTYEKPHKCPECDYASVELSKLKRHMRSHTGERPYQCPHCTYASPDTYKLKRHLRIHTGEKPYECDICHTRFTQSNSLKAHKLIHSGNKPIYQCELCPTTCGRKTDLKIHVQKLHTSEKPLQCKKCGKSFPDRYTWKIHVKTHEGEKCFKCELCPYAALSQRHLESHLLTHTGEKPFECDECEQSFRQKQLLKRHKNLYHNPDYVPPAPKDKCHECPECGKAFAHKGNLLRHRAGHDPDNQEYQEALANYRAEQGEDYDEEAEEEDELEDEEEMEETEQQLIVTQAVVGDGQTYQTDASGQVHLANINGQQVQLQLVNLNDENNTQVYIQIDSGHQLQNLMEQQVADEMEEEEEEAEPETMEVETPVSHGEPKIIRATRLDIKEEDMKQEGDNIPRIANEEQYITTSSGKHQIEIFETPTKRTRRDSPKKLKGDEDEEEVERKREQKKKDIETCFGFEEI